MRPIQNNTVQYTVHKVKSNKYIYKIAHYPHSYFVVEKNDSSCSSYLETAFYTAKKEQLRTFHWEDLRRKEKREDNIMAHEKCHKQSVEKPELYL